MVADLVLLGLGIALQPFRLSAFILILSSKDGTRKGLGFVLGWLASLVLVIAVVVLVTGGKPLRLFTLPATVVQIARLALGVALIVLAVVQSRKRGRPRILTTLLTRLDTMSPWTAAVIAAVMQPWTLVAAGAATVLEAKISTPGSVLALIIFCLLATSSYLYLELYAVLRPVRAGARLDRLRIWLDTHQDQVIILICLLIGSWLVGNSIYLLVSVT